MPGLNNRAPAPYIPGMPKSRVPAPKQTIKVRSASLKEGDAITLTAKVTRVKHSDYPGLDRITFKIPGYGIPITVIEQSLKGDEDA